jgi:hypothetical protein
LDDDAVRLEDAPTVWSSWRTLGKYDKFGRLMKSERLPRVDDCVYEIGVRRGEDSPVTHALYIGEAASLDLSKNIAFVVHFGQLFRKEFAGGPFSQWTLQVRTAPRMPADLRDRLEERFSYIFTAVREDVPFRISRPEVLHAILESQSDEM